MVDIREVASRLYGVPLPDFVAARAEAVKDAKGAGDVGLARRIGHLKKPTVSAWTLNMLARREDALVGEVIDLGERLRRAQTASDGPALRALEKERRALVGRWVGVARDDASAPSSAVLLDVEATVRAALAEPAAGEALRDGLLVKPLSPAGFGSVDVTGSLAIPELAPAVDESVDDESADDDRAAPSTTARDRAHAQLASAAEEMEAAAAISATAETDLEEAVATAERTAAERDELAERLEAATKAAADAKVVAAELRTTATTRAREARQASDRHERARRRLDNLS